MRIVENGKAVCGIVLQAAENTLPRKNGVPFTVACL